MKVIGDIVQTKTKAVKAMIGKILFSVTIVKLAYQKVNSFDVSELGNFYSDKSNNSRKYM